MCATKFPAITKAGKAPPSGRFDYRKIVKLQISPVAKMENQLAASAPSRSTSAEVIVAISERPALALAWQRIADYGCLLRLSGASSAHPTKISTGLDKQQGKRYLSTQPRLKQGFQDRLAQTLPTTSWVGRRSGRRGGRRVDKKRVRRNAPQPQQRNDVRHTCLTSANLAAEGKVWR